MAMNLGYKTTKLLLGYDLRITNAAYDAGFKTDGTWDTGYKIATARGSSVNPNENDYIDLGIVTDENEQTSIGSVRIPIPFTANAYNWAIGGRVIRVTISGIIPDGVYVSMGTDVTNNPYTNLNGLSNVSVFRFKMARFITYSTFSLNNIQPTIVQYRRKYLYEVDDDTDNWFWGSSTYTPGTYTNFAKWTVTGFSGNFIQGTRNYAYTINLDLANNSPDLINAPTMSGVNPRPFGDPA